MSPFQIPRQTPSHQEGGKSTRQSCWKLWESWGHLKWAFGGDFKFQHLPQKGETSLGWTEIQGLGIKLGRAWSSQGSRALDLFLCQFEWEKSALPRRVILIPPSSSQSGEIPGFGTTAERPQADLSRSRNISTFRNKYFQKEPTSGGNNSGSCPTEIRAPA